MSELHPSILQELSCSIPALDAPHQVLLDCPATHSTQPKAFQTQGQIQQCPFP